MNKEYFTRFLDDFNYPEEAKSELTKCYESIEKSGEFRDKIDRILGEYDRDVNVDFKLKIAEINGTTNLPVHPYSAVLITLILATEKLKERYKEKNISVGIWENSVKDLLYKCIECRLVYGVWGTFVDWFSKFYNLKRFGLGRLQFETALSPYDFDNGKNRLNSGDKILRVHIPRTGTKLKREEQVSAYKQASEFFKDYFGESQTVFTCDSWLLYPPLKQMLKPDSNLSAFISDYMVIKEGIYEDFFSWSWRLYDTEEKDIDKLPVDSSLRKNYVDYIKAGNKSGWGYGVFFYKDK